MFKFRTDSDAVVGDPGFTCDSCAKHTVELQEINYGPKDLHEDHRSAILLCASCAGELMVLLYVHLIGGSSDLRSVLPLNREHAQMLLAERKLARECYDAVQRRDPLTARIKRMVLTMERKADLFMANVGRALTWQ